MAHANTEQLIAAWSTLNARDFLILRKMATALIPGTCYSEPQDLLHEAYVRALDGRRNWPLHIHFSVFLGNAMRSIAKGERTAQKRRGARSVDFEDFMSNMQHLAATPSVLDEALEVEKLRLGRKAADELRDKLEGDDPARQVLSGIVAGLSPKETRETCGMDEKTFDAAMHRILRRARAGRVH